MTVLVKFDLYSDLVDSTAIGPCIGAKTSIIGSLLTAFLNRRQNVFTTSDTKTNKLCTRPSIICFQINYSAKVMNPNFIDNLVSGK
jgi:hypothetical protein